MRIPKNPRDHAKVARIVQLYLDGNTLDQIGCEYGITRQRVHQIVKSAGLSAKDGGASKIDSGREQKRNAVRDQICLSLRGCTYAQYRSLMELGKGMTPDTSPLGAFREQKQNAKVRGIEWNLKLWEWWQIWQDSGKWGQRGRGHRYCMARHGDTGPYAVGNVYICTGSQNTRDYQLNARAA